MRGRKPKPTVLKELHRSTEPINRHEPKPEGPLAAAPAHFDEDQRAAWAYALQHAPPGMLKMIDAGVLECWVVAQCYHRRAVVMQASLGARGLVVRTPNTRQMVQSPFLPIINRQALIMSKLAAELGFSPTARPRVGLTLGGDALNGSSTHGSEGQGQETLQQYLARAPSTEAVH
jgi:P27 family predicted phage terminase small subunit